MAARKNGTDPAVLIAEAITHALEDLRAGDPRGARDEGWARFLSASAAKHRAAPGPALMETAQWAGMLIGFAANMAQQLPPQVAGYDGGQPTADQLVAAFEHGRAAANGLAGLKGGGR